MSRSPHHIAQLIVMGLCLFVVSACSSGKQADSTETVSVQATRETNATATTVVGDTPADDLAMPSTPGSVVSTIQDHRSVISAPERTTTSDFLFINLLERPFTPIEMDYLGFLDIISAELSFDESWVYVSITVEEALPPGARAYFSVEIDIDLDDRGDILFWGQTGPDAQWTPGVAVYQDQNGNVGGNKPHLAERPDPEWDGYDFLSHSSGSGVAWIRRAEANDRQVWIAFQRDLLGGAEVFIWRVWSQGGGPQGAGVISAAKNAAAQVNEIVFDPRSFDYNDFIHPNRAGSPIRDSKFYPLKDLAAVDNSCRQLYGAELLEPRPGFCGVEIVGVRPSATAPNAPATSTPPDDVVYPDQPDEPDEPGEPDEPQDEDDPQPTETPCVDTVAAPCDDDDQYPEDDDPPIIVIEHEEGQVEWLGILDNVGPPTIGNDP